MSGSRSIDERYFDWLCKQVGIVSKESPDESHTLLAEQLFKAPFEDFVPNDFNRAKDGLSIRYDFVDSKHLKPDQAWLELDCSVLEMLIALAHRLSFHTEWAVEACFWLLITNLELVKYSDDKYHDGVSEAVTFVINTLNDRTYEYNGQGGVFPLKDPQFDQRGVEIWYQMSAYLLENFEL